jgi:hypothetical protein
LDQKESNVKYLEIDGDIINYNLVKIINNFEFFNQISSYSCVKKSNVKYLKIEEVEIAYT